MPKKKQFSTEREAKLFCDTHNKLLVQIDSLCARWEKRLHATQNPTLREVAKTIYKQCEHFQKVVHKEMDRIDFEFKDRLEK